MSEGTKHLPTKIIFMRHGEAEHNVNDTVDSHVTSTVALTEEGRHQVAETAHLLMQDKPDYIICSPLLRTRQTAILVAETLDIPLSEIHEEHELRELDCGEWNGKSYAEFMTLFTSHIDVYYKNPHLGESEGDCFQRLKDYLESILHKEHYAGKTLLLITHGAIVRVAHMLFMGHTPEETYHEEACPICPTGQFRRYEFSWVEGSSGEEFWERIHIRNI